MGDSVLQQFTPKKEEAAIDTSKKLKIGIIGTGWIAEAHAEALLQCPDVEIVALADLIPGKAEKFAARYGITGARFYPSHKEMIDSEELDGVHVCTYTAPMPNARAMRWTTACTFCWKSP